MALMEIHLINKETINMFTYSTSNNIVAQQKYFIQEKNSQQTSQKKPHQTFLSPLT